MPAQGPLQADVEDCQGSVSVHIAWTMPGISPEVQRLTGQTSGIINAEGRVLDSIQISKL